MVRGVRAASCVEKGKRLRMALGKTGRNELQNQWN